MEYRRIGNEYLYWGCEMIKTILSDYLINEYGVIYSKISKKYLHQYTDKYGYKYVSLRGKKYKVHRLVAEAFVSRTNGKCCIDHIDCDKSNNFYKNLRWVTPKENSNNKITIEKLKEIGKRYKTEYGKPIIDKKGNKYISIMEASRVLGIGRSNIQYHLKNKTGEWEYV